MISTPNFFGAMYLPRYDTNYDHTIHPERTPWLCLQTVRETTRRCEFTFAEPCFVDDHQLELTASLPYRMFASAWRWLRVLLPKRFRSVLLGVSWRASHASRVGEGQYTTDDG